MDVFLISMYTGKGWVIVEKKKLTDHPGHDTANVIGYLKDMGNGGRIQQLVLQQKVTRFIH